MQTSATPESSLESTCASAAPSATSTCTPNPICHEGVPHPTVRLVINGSSGLEVKHHRPDYRRAETGGRGGRQRAAGSRVGGRHRPREKREVDGSAHRELAVAEAGAGAS